MNMRTAKEFDQTYELVCTGGGLVIDVPAVVQFLNLAFIDFLRIEGFEYKEISTIRGIPRVDTNLPDLMPYIGRVCLLYTSPSPRDATLSRMPSSA